MLLVECDLCTLNALFEVKLRCRNPVDISQICINLKFFQCSIHDSKGQIETQYYCHTNHPWCSSFNGFFCSFLAAVIRHILQLIEQTKAATLEANGEVRKILHILSSSGVDTSFKDYSETIESVKQMQSVDELLNFCHKLNENPNYRKQVVCTVSWNSILSIHVKKNWKLYWLS